MRCLQQHKRSCGVRETFGYYEYVVIEVTRLVFWRGWTYVGLQEIHLETSFNVHLETSFNVPLHKCRLELDYHGYLRNFFFFAVHKNPENLKNSKVIFVCKTPTKLLQTMRASRCAVYLKVYLVNIVPML